MDIVWAAQTELQRKYKSRTVEKPPLKIKQEPLAVRVKQEVAEIGYDQQQAVNANVGVGANDDYDVMADGNHEDGDDPGAVDQKYEFCDFPINDCDIMEIINLDDPFINIPDDDNTIVNEETEEVQKPINERINHLPSAHELLQAHMLLDEHNYAYVDTTDDFKEERQVYKTEKSDSEERLNIEASTIPPDSGNNAIYEQPSSSYSQEMMNTQFEYRRALKPIVTSVSAIQATAPSKGNSIVVLNESIVKSGSGGCQLHSCMVCHLNFFSVENLKEHYTQTHGTPMVTVPASNIVFERNSSDSKCNMKKEIIENIEICSAKNVSIKMPEIVAESTNITEEDHVEKQEETKLDNVTNDSICSPPLKSKNITKNIRHGNALRKTRSKSKHQQHKVNKLARSYPHMISLNTMASQYQQLKKLYQTLQKKCLNLEQNVEQLQLLPSTINSKPVKTLRQQVQQTKSLSNKSDPKPMLPPMADSRTMVPPTSVTPTKSTCPICLKMFPNSNSLRQHKITHTEERKHICTLCQRSFKRRNGLLQHFKGFHLQVKPFTCQICNHSYALKCDMLRCKHSALKSSRNTTTEQ